MIIYWLERPKIGQLLSIQGSFDLQVFLVKTKPPSHLTKTLIVRLLEGFKI